MQYARIVAICGMVSIQTVAMDFASAEDEQGVGVSQETQPRTKSVHGSDNTPKVDLSKVYLSGIWVSSFKDQASFFQLIDHGDSIIVRCISSAAILDLDGVLLRHGKELTHQYWHFRAKNDPSRKVYSLTFSATVVDKDTLRAKLQEVRWNSEGKETARESRSAKWSRLSEAAATAVLTKTRQSRDSDRNRLDTALKWVAVGYLAWKAYESFDDSAVAAQSKEASTNADGKGDSNRQEEGRSSYNVGDYVQNTGVLQHWIGRIVEIDGNVHKVRITYSDRSGETEYRVGNSLDLLADDMKLARGRSIKAIIRGSK